MVYTNKYKPIVSHLQPRQLPGHPVPVELLLAAAPGHGGQPGHHRARGREEGGCTADMGHLTLMATVLCPSPAKGARPTTMRKLPMAATGARLTV